MSSVVHGNNTYELDDYGFLDPPEQWDETFAEGMAKTVGIKDGLTERHWEFVRYLRQKFIEERTVPVLVMACADNDMRLSELRSLFPTGYHRGACKVAGINYRFMYETNYWLTYETAPPAKPRYRIDALGFLEDSEEWDEDFVRLVLTQQGSDTPPTKKLLEVIRYLRLYYAANHTIPTVFETCSVNALSLEDLRELFPAGYRRGACRMAGLPFFG